MLTNMSLEAMNAMSAGTLMEQLGIIYTEVGPDYICGTMPVDHRTVQPAGLLHRSACRNAGQHGFGCDHGPETRHRWH